MAREPAAIARGYVGRINEHDIPGMMALMTEDHRFIDATEQVVSGRDQVRSAWERYFSWFPDYRMEVADLVATDAIVAIFGHASGCFSGKRSNPKLVAWRIPAAWRAVVRNGQLAEWQVYCDVEPMLRGMGEARFDAEKS